MQLSGIRVVDLSRIVSGPFCSMFLADMGAEVIKIEDVDEGDPVRKQGVMRNGFSLYFASFNRNKRSLTLDLRSAEGKAVLRKLIATADVVLDNFRPGVMEKIGLSRAELQAIKPDIVSCHITGFGLDGPYRDRPSFDFIAQAMSGFMSVNGAEDEAPARAAPPLSDLIAGAYAAMGICAALVRRERTGHGEEVATSLTDSMIANLAFLASHYFETGEQPLRTGNDHALVAPYGLFEATDGQVAIAPSNDQVYFKLLDALGLSHLREHPGIPDQRRSLRAPRRDQRADQRRDPQAADRPLARRAERGRRAVRPRDEPEGSVRRPADPAPADEESRSTIRGTGRSTCSAFPSSSPTTRAACIGRRPSWARTPTRSWANSATARRRSRRCTSVDIA